MIDFRHLWMLTTFLLALGPPALAEDAVVDGKPCNALCQRWMGLPATVDARPVAAPHIEQPAVANAPVPAAAPGSLTPSPRTSRIDPRAVEDSASTLTDEQYALAYPPLAPEDSVRPPDPSRLVAVRGVVMVETAGEKEANRKQRAALIRGTIKRGPIVGDVVD